MVGNHRTITQTATDDLSRYGGVYATHPHPITHQATTIFSPAASVTASTGFVPSLASPSKGEHIISNGGSYTPTSLAPCPPVTIKMSTSGSSPALQSRDPGSTAGSKKRSSSILEDKRKRKCWEVESATSSPGPKVAIATPTVKNATKATVPVALTSPTSRRTLSPVVGAELDQVTLSGTLPPHKSSTYPTVANKKDSLSSPSPGLSTTSSLRAIRPCKTSEPSSNLPLTSTTTSGIPVGIAVARQRSTSSHVAVTNTTTTSYPDLNGMTATHSLAGNIHTGTANGLHSVGATSMGPGQCLPAMTLLTCDDGNASNASAWGSPWHYPLPLESQMPQLSQPSNLQLVRDPNSGQFLLLPTASFDPMPRTVVWPSHAGQGGPQLILPHSPHPQATPLILDNRLVALSTPAPAPVSPTGADKQRRGPHQHQPATLVKLDDSPLTGVMMPSTDYSKATIGSDANGYAVIHHPPSFINPNFSAISSSSGSFLIQHISRNNNNAPMQMSNAPTIFNNGGRTNNLLISTQQLPAGAQQLTLASPSGDMKDNIATICYDNLYHNTTTTTMFNLQQTTSVMNQQTTSTQQMSTTSILVNNDKISGGNSTFNVDPQVESCNTSTSNYNNHQVDISSGNNEAHISYNSNQMQSSNFTGANSNYCNDQEVGLENENSTGNEDSQTSAGTQDEEEEDEADEQVTTKNDAGNQTDMPDEAKPDSDDNCSQESTAQNSISDKPMSLNHGDENSLEEHKEDGANTLCEKNSVSNEAQDTALSETNNTELLSKIDSRHISITPIVKTTDQPREIQKVSTCDKHTNDVPIDTHKNISILESNSKCTVNATGPSSNSISPDGKKKIKQMPSLYPIHRFLPNVNNEVNTADTKLVGFRSMPLLEDATKQSKQENKTAMNEEVADDTALVVNALMGLGNNGAEFEKKKQEQLNKYVKCDKAESSILSAIDLDKSDNKGNHVEVKPTPRVFSVSDLLDKNFPSKNRESVKRIEQPIVQISTKSDAQSAQNYYVESSSSSCVETERSNVEHNTGCESDGSDEILEVANILCSALFTSKSERTFQHPDLDADKESDSGRWEKESSRKDSESSGESGVDLSGLELLSNSIEQFERVKDGPGELEEKAFYRGKFSDREDDSVQSDETSHNDSGISRGLDFLCALAQERILEESLFATSPQHSSDSAAWAQRRLSKHHAQTPSRWMMSSDTDDEMFVQPYKPRLYKRPPGVPYKELSHTYRSLKSEQVTRQVLASKQTYQYVPPTSIDLKEAETRKLLAEIQREFREAQKELTRLTPKKSPHTPPTDSSHGWRVGGPCEAASCGGPTGLSSVKRKPGRPRKTDKDVESLKHSGKKVRDMITDRSNSPSPAKHVKDRVEPRTKLSVQMPPTPCQLAAAQVKTIEQSPPVLTPFSTTPLDTIECSRPPTLVKRHENSTSAVGGNYYRGRLLQDDLDSDDSDQAEPPQLSPESAATSRKRGRPPKKQAQTEPPVKKQATPEPPVKKPALPELLVKKQFQPEPLLKKQATPEPPVKKPSRPNFVSIVLANKNKQAAQKSVWDDAFDYKPNKIRPKLKAEAKVKTALSVPDSEDDVSDIEDRPVSITVRKPSLAAGSTHVKIKPTEMDVFRQCSGPEPVEKMKKAAEPTCDVRTKNGVCKRGNGQETDATHSGKLAKKATSPETNGKKHKHDIDTSKALTHETSVKKHKHDSESPKVLTHETSVKKHKQNESESSKTHNYDISVKKHKQNDNELSKAPNHDISAKKYKQNDSESSKAHNHDISVKKHKHDSESSKALNHDISGKKHKHRDSDSCDLAVDSKPPVLPSVKRVKRAESGSSVGSAVSCGNTVPCETEQGDCKVTVEYLTHYEDTSTRVLVLNEGLLYAGQLTAISPPDIYGVQLDGERAHRPNIYSQEEVLRDVILEVKLALSSVKPGKRMCAYWSQQYRCLYPGVVVSETTSRATSTSPTFVNVEFDDGDSGSINVDDIRMLPQDFPLMTYADPLLTLGACSTKRKRRNSSTSVDETGGPPREKMVRLDATIVEENEEEVSCGRAGTVDRERDEKPVDVTPAGDRAEQGSDSSGKVRSKSHKMKKRKRSREEKREHKKHKKHKHKHRHKEKRRRPSSCTELSNSGTSSVTEEHIKLAIKPIAEIVHKEDDASDPLKITVKRDVICETHIVNETHIVKQSGVVEKVVVPVQKVITEEETESNDSMRTEVEEEVELTEDSADVPMTVDPSEVKANGLYDVNDVQAEDETHESLVLTISTSDACPKIVRDERKSLDVPDSKTKPDTCARADSLDKEKVDEVKARKEKKSAKTHTGKEHRSSVEDKSKKNTQAADETKKNEDTKDQWEQKKSKAERKEKEPLAVDGACAEEEGKKRAEQSEPDPSGSEDSRRETASPSVDKPSSSDAHSPTESKVGRKSPKVKQPAKERQSSVDSKSSMTHFLPEKQLWDWAGTSYKRCTTKKKGRKLFYKSIQRGDESLSVGDCAVFLSTETDQPYIGKIDGFWESHASMHVKVKWFYHPEETVGCPQTLPCYQGALFEASHFDENDIQTISHKCQVLALPDYERQLAETHDPTDLYYLAGLYDHINRKIQLEPGVHPTAEPEAV